MDGGEGGEVERWGEGGSERWEGGGDGVVGVFMKVNCEVWN